MLYARLITAIGFSTGLMLTALPFFAKYDGGGNSVYFPFIGFAVWIATISIVCVFFKDLKRED